MQDRDCVPQVQYAPTYNGHEGGSSPQDFPGPPEGVRRPEQGQVSQDPDGLWFGTQVSPDSLVYWGHVTMLANTGGYYAPPFKGYHGVTQVNPLSPAIFNMAVDAVI